MSKLITVFGATGNQGGSVIRTILADPGLSKEFRIRAVTRNVDKESSKALTAQGVEVVQVCFVVFVNIISLGTDLSCS